MRIERYYASVREEVSPLTTEAGSLLDAGDYIGFFKACGPNYIRGIRRAQEVTAFFMFRSSSDESASTFSNSVRSSHWRRHRYSNTNSGGSSSNTERQSMKIVIKGWGLGLSQDGSETLVSSSLEEFKGVMDFAFSTMTRVPDSLHIGQVYGMEVAPWVSNVGWQVRAELLDNAIEIPVVRSLIPRAFRISNPSDVAFDNTSDETRALFQCKEISYVTDQYGFCCEEETLYDYASREYDASNPSERICRPLRILDPALIKENLAANGEFIARMDRSVRYKMNQMFLLERCISAVRAIPDRYDFYLLKGLDTNASTELDISVFEMKLALDPFNDYAILKHMAKELDEFLDMFIQPCYAALFGSNAGSSPETDASYLMLYPWHSHNECTKLSCLGNSMRWDRSAPDGGCTPSLIAGVSSSGYDTTNEGNCNIDFEKSGDNMACKHDTQLLQDTFDSTMAVWNEVIPTGRVDFFMDQYCLPSIRQPAETLPPLQIDALRKTQLRTVEQRGMSEMSINVALNKPSRQMSTWHDGRGNRAPASRANDGNTDGRFWTGRSISITFREDDPWWEVDLELSYEIMTVAVWNRIDGGEHGAIAQRLSGFVVILYLEEREVWTSERQVQVLDEETLIEVPRGTMADTVRIQIPDTYGYLQLAEVKVMNRFYA